MRSLLAIQITYLMPLITKVWSYCFISKQWSFSRWNIYSTSDSFQFSILPDELFSTTLKKIYWYYYRWTCSGQILRESIPECYWTEDDVNILKIDLLLWFPLGNDSNFTLKRFSSIRCHRWRSPDCINASQTDKLLHLSFKRTRSQQRRRLLFINLLNG